MRLRRREESRRSMGKQREAGVGGKLVHRAKEGGALERLEKGMQGQEQRCGGGGWGGGGGLARNV